MEKSPAPVARRYHEVTAHSPESVRRSEHTLDWDNKPFPFKIYTDLPGVALPRDIDVLATPTLAAIAEARAPSDAMTMDTLASLLYYAAGVTKQKTYAGGLEVLFRAAPSTGALYQTEVYVVAGAVEGLTAGVYHFCPGDFALRLLREGDARATLAQAAAEPALGRRAATLVLTAIVWRNAWKYRARAYRHLFWDSGTMLANALATGAALGLAPHLYTGFADATVHHLLGVDAEREPALALLALGPETAPAPAATEWPPIAHASMPLSRAPVDEPLVSAAHAASTLGTPDEVSAWRRGRLAPAPPPPAGLVPLPVPDAAAGRALGETIQRRGSTRRFGHAPISVDELAAALWAASRPIPQDVPGALVDIYVSAHAVTGLAPGSYAYQRDAHALEPLAAGDFRQQAAFLCLEQPLGGDAAATLFFLARLDAVLEAFGERGYRVANLEAGLAGGRAYLAAYALGFGASGLTFYDADVVRFFSPRAAGADAIFVTALGRAGTTAGDVLLSSAISAPRRRT
jgi:SagB-type dehydrogenase family enzyme